jgi:AMP deaminase
MQVKMHWVHQRYWKMGPEGNDIQKTNVPNLRMRFRAETFYDELGTVSVST